MISTSNSSMNEIISERFNFSYLGTNLTVSLPVFSLIFPVPSFTNFYMLSFTSLFSCGRIPFFKCSYFCLMSLHTILESGEHSHFRCVVSDFSQSAVRKSKKVAYDVNERVMFCFFAESRSGVPQGSLMLEFLNAGVRQGSILGPTLFLL